jgi:hypothetical protein
MLPRSLRLALDVDHKLNESNTLMARFERARSDTVLRGRNSNAPAASGQRPFPQMGNVTEIEAAGYWRDTRLMLSWVAALPGPTNCNVGYIIGSTTNEADSALSLPSDSRTPAADRGPSANDIRHRLFGMVMWRVTRAISLVGDAAFSTGAPYTVTTGRDDNGDTVANDRPAGVGRNSRRGASHLVVNARVLYRRQLGRSRQEGAEQADGRAVTVHVAAENLLNRTNPRNYTGVLGSPLFGRPAAAAAKRRIEIGLSLLF